MQSTQNFIRPSGIERSFGEDEIIVSKTDPRGRITYANRVFLRVARYSEEQVLGKPHSVIRHPDMPRSVFKLLWDTIREKQEIFAYVVNLAADGAHYWVLAHVTPTLDEDGEITGYHSNRRLPRREAVDSAADLYRRLLEEERRFDDPREGLAAGCAMLEELLQQNGVSYDEFAWSL